MRKLSSHHHGHFMCLSIFIFVSLFFTSCRKSFDTDNKQAKVTDGVIGSSVNGYDPSSTFELGALRPDFITGVNGHPLNQQAYLSTPVNKQIQLLTSLHLKSYRIDIATNANGVMQEENKFYALAAAAVANNITLLPMLYLTGLQYGILPDTAFSRGYVLGRGFAMRYGGFFDVYEMGNEHDWEILKSSLLYGESIMDYDMHKYNVLSAFFNGLNEGLKTADPAAKTMIDANINHVGFFRLLQLTNVNFDIVGDHFYLNDIFSIPWHTMVVKRVTDMFRNTKPVWITEANKWKGSYNNTEDVQNSLMSQFMAVCKANPLIQSLYVYELLDEPELAIAPGDESFERNFGLVKWVTPYSDMVPKKLAATLQSN